MDLSAKEQAFLERRERLLRYWPMVGPAIIVLIALFGVWLMLQAQFGDAWLAYKARVRKRLWPTSPQTVV